MTSLAALGTIYFLGFSPLGELPSKPDPFSLIIAASFVNSPMRTEVLSLSFCGGNSSWQYKRANEPELLSGTFSSDADTRTGVMKFLQSCRAVEDDLQGQRPVTHAHFSFLLVDSHGVSGGVIDRKKTNSSLLKNPSINQVFSSVRKQIYGKGSDGINGLIWPVYASGVHQRAIRIDGDRTGTQSGVSSFPAFVPSEAEADKHQGGQKANENPVNRYVFPETPALSRTKDSRRIPTTPPEKVASIEETKNPKSALLVASSHRSPHQEMLLISFTEGGTTWSLIDQVGSSRKSGVPAAKQDRRSGQEAFNAPLAKSGRLNPQPEQRNPDVDFSCALFSGSNLVDFFELSTANKNTLFTSSAFAISRKQLSDDLKAPSPWFHAFLAQITP